MPEELEDEVMEEMDEEVETEETVEEVGEEAIVNYVKECFNEGGEAAGLTGDEAIDAVIVKLEAMKSISPTESPLGGLGGGEFPDLEDED